VNEKTETIIEMATAYQAGPPESLVVVIPRRVREKLNITKGQRFLVKTDDKGRIIYEPTKRGDVHE